MKNFNTSAKLLVVAALVASAGMASANIVLNPSFELGNFDDVDVAFVPMVTQLGGFQSNTKITNWTVSQDRPLIWIDNAYPGPLKTPSGTKFLDLTFYTFITSNYSSVSQDLFTTMGQQYTLSFDLGSSNFFGVQPVIALSTAGVTVNFAMTAAPTSVNQWTSFSFNFTAPAAMTPITFTGIQGSDFIGLDNISVTAVPEPGTMAMLFAGLAAVGTVVARKRKQIS